MSSDMTGRTARPQGRPPVGGRGGRSSGGNAGSTIAIVVTAVALILGFVILRRIDDNSGTTIQPGDTSTVDTNGSVDTIDPLGSTLPATTLPAQTFTGTVVQVANSSQQNGVAGMMTTALKGLGFTTAEATNGTSQLDVSKVIYRADDPAALPVATTLAAILGGLNVEAAGVPLPVQSGAWAEGSSVVLLLGNDLAGKTLDQIAGVAVTGQTTTTLP